MEYQFRLSAADQLKTYKLEEDGISYGDWKIPYHEIKVVKLSYTPTRYHSNFYKCEVFHKKSSIVLSNRHYVKLGTFDEQDETYNAFIEAFHQKLVAYSSIKFQTGLSPASYWGQAIFSLVFFPLILIAMFTFGQLIVGAVFLLVILLRVVPYFIKNKPSQYNPTKLPEKMLP